MLAWHSVFMVTTELTAMSVTDNVIGVPGDLVSMQILSDWGLRACSSNKLPGELCAADLGNNKGIGQWFSKCDFPTSSIGSAWKLITNANSWAPSQIY